MSCAVNSSATARSRASIPESDTETFIALKCLIDNWRWAGVPFFLRTGKRMAEGQRIISIAFREPPKSMFPVDSGLSSQGPDHLTFDLADESRVSLSFYGKKPGPGMRLNKQSLQFAMQRDRPRRRRARGLRAAHPRRHARRSHAVLLGRGHRAAVGSFRAAARQSPPPVKVYAPGSWGPQAIYQLIAPHAWRLPFERAWREGNAASA